MSERRPAPSLRTLLILLAVVLAICITAIAMRLPHRSADQKILLDKSR